MWNNDLMKVPFRPEWRWQFEFVSFLMERNQLEQIAFKFTLSIARNFLKKLNLNVGATECVNFVSFFTQITRNRFTGKLKLTLNVSHLESKETHLSGINEPE